MIPLAIFLVCVAATTGLAWWWFGLPPYVCLGLAAKICERVKRHLCGPIGHWPETRRRAAVRPTKVTDIHVILRVADPALAIGERGSVNPRLLLWGVVALLLMAFGISGLRQWHQRQERGLGGGFGPISIEPPPFLPGQGIPIPSLTGGLPLEMTNGSQDTATVEPLVPEPPKEPEYYGQVTKLQRPLEMPNSFTVPLPEPLDAASYMERALLRFNRLNFTGAIADCTKAIELTPRSHLPYRVRAYAELAHGDFLASINDATRSIDLKPEQYDAYYVRGTARQYAGDFEGALADLGKAIQVNPNNPAPYNARGWARYRKGDLAGAIQDATQSLALSPSGADAYDTRAWAKFAGGDTDGAMADCRNSDQYGGDSQAAMSSRGLAWYIMGDFAEAVTEWNRAITTMPYSKIDLAEWIAKAQQHLPARER
jgi:Tfp pilus assembly protein PilF